MSLLMRIFFCALPSVAVGCGLYLIAPFAGLILAVGIFMLGWSVTAPKIERGETE